jgi:single-stranded-DNA-specific exonuclease
LNCWCRRRALHPERLKDLLRTAPVAIERLHVDGVALVISVDCGIRADAARAELGVDLIITDHHEPEPSCPRLWR